jgi:hypothetical protein
MRPEQCDRRQVLEEPSDRVQRHVVFGAVVRRECGCAVTPQRDVQVLGAARVLRGRLGHEAGDLAVPAGHLLGGVLESRRVVGGRQCVGVDKIGLHLAGAVFRLDAFQSREGTQCFVEIRDQRIECVGVLE